MDALTRERPATALHRQLRAARAHTDALFSLVADATLYDRPIADRHRLIFYVGHFDAFDWNQLARGVLDLPAFVPTFDRLFEAGIDPAPGQAPADRPADWPTLNEVRRYVEQARLRIDERLDELPAERLLTALEHRWMHAETLCYLLHQLDPQKKRAPLMRPPPIAACEQHVRRAGWVAIPAGIAMLGQSEREFGWDNEFPQHAVAVDDFEIARHKVTNGDYRRFVEAGGAVPPFWQQRDGRWAVQRMFDTAPLKLDAPVYLTHQQAEAFAAWAGARLPTEAEWQRAAYAAGARRFPWGDADQARGNFDFIDWDPRPVHADPAAATPLGVQQMVGNGWEWTATPFAGFDGFNARHYYPGYSANFFDGDHFVLKGASPRTARRLARPSFRNWFRREYPYAYTTVRLAR
jgi:formylglycine-generating enzyme required for sulfatase activity